MTAETAAVVRGLNARRNGAGWIARCPVPGHEDKNPSFGISEEDGKLLVCCYAGCPQDVVIEALKDRGLWSERNRDQRFNEGYRNGTARNGQSGARPAAVHAPQNGSVTRPQPAEELRKNLASSGWNFGQEFMYGTELRKVRFEHANKMQPEKNRPQKSFRWEHCGSDGRWYVGDGGKPKPAYVNEVYRERDQVEFAVGCEGEAKADSLGSINTPAFSFRELTPDSAAVVQGVDVCLWPDNDEPGQQKALRAAELIGKYARSVRIITPPPGSPKAWDVIDALSMGWTAERIQALIASAKKIGSEIRSIEELPSIRSFQGQQINWVVESLIAEGTVTLFSGESGGGKTTWATALAGAVATGEMIASLRTSRRKVLSLDNESPLPVAQERMARLGVEDGPFLHVWGGWHVQEPPPANSPLVRDWVASWIRNRW